MKTSIVIASCDLCGREEETREGFAVLIKEPDGWYHILVSREHKTDAYPYPFLDVCPACFEAKVKPFMDSLVGEKVTIR